MYKRQDGKHTFAIQKKGYKTVTKTFEFKAVKADGMFIDGEDPWVEDGTLYLPVSYTHLDVYKRQDQSFFRRT